MIALIDCNNFYASCERVFKPYLEGKPVVILSNNDGCIIARSNEAKTVGIPMGAPIHTIEKMVKEHKVTVFSSNYVLYGSFSNRVMQTLLQFTPKMEVYSIDEAFLDLSGMDHVDLYRLGIRIRETVWTNVGIPVSVGIASTKTLAKMANRFAKKARKEVGVYVADTPQSIAEMLQNTEVGDIWGIGRQHAKKLLAKKIVTAADLIRLNEDWVRTNMTVVGVRMLHELKGMPSIEWDDVPSTKKGICTSRSFGQLLTNKDDIAQAVATYANSCAGKLRKQKSCTSLVHVFVHTNVHRTQDEQYFKSISIPLPVATNSSRELIHYALQGLDKIFVNGINYKKAGVMVFDIVPQGQIQFGLFDKVDREKEDRLMKAYDNINKTLGNNIVRFAAQGYGKKWSLRQEKLSQCYTTNFNELCIIKI